MSYTVKGYNQGRTIAEGEAMDISEALSWADEALHGSGGVPHCDEIEVTTEYKDRELLVAWIMDDDRALEEPI